MSTKHTPGPWRRELDGPFSNDMRHAVLAECNDLWVAACYRSGTTAQNDISEAADAEAQANADLIAAAPDMLQALRKAVVALAAVSVHAPELGAHETYEVVSAAIAKATGSPA